MLLKKRPGANTFGRLFFISGSMVVYACIVAFPHSRYILLYIPDFT